MRGGVLTSVGQRCGFFKDQTFLFVIIRFMMVSEGSKITEIKKVISNVLPESEVILLGSGAITDANRQSNPGKSNVPDRW
jgi:hypothetical protein